ncbi:MAG TPA: hypothetical protein VIN11_05450 [Roseivirga sp.]
MGGRIRKYLTLLMLLSLPLALKGQTLNKELIKIGKLDFHSTKEKIVAALGEPNEITEPNYECGFLSSEEQGKPFFKLSYEHYHFVGNDEDGYLIEELYFNQGVSISYNGVNIDKDITLDGLIEVFGMELFGSFHDTSTDSKLIRFDMSDSGVIFYLTNGKLSKMEYWSPC